MYKILILSLFQWTGSYMLLNRNVYNIILYDNDLTIIQNWFWNETICLLILKSYNDSNVLQLT